MPAKTAGPVPPPLPAFDEIRGVLPFVLRWPSVTFWHLCFAARDILAFRAELGPLQVLLEPIESQVAVVRASWPPREANSRSLATIPYASIARIRLDGGSDLGRVPTLTIWTVGVAGRSRTKYRWLFSRGAYTRDREKAVYAKIVLERIRPPNLEIARL